MKISKIFAAVAAAAIAVSMVAVNVFAGTVELDSDYPGAWKAGKFIPKSEFEAVGGDVKVVLTVETKEPVMGQHNHLAVPMDSSWNRVTDRLTSDTAIAKNDGFFVFADGQTSIEFVVPADLIAEFDDNGLGFQVSDVIIKSAELSEGTPQSAIRRVEDAESEGIMAGQSYEEVKGAAASDGDTTSTGTGNVPAAAMLAVMAVAGTAVVASRKRK